MNTLDDFEQFLQQSAYYGEGELKVVDLHSNLHSEIELLGKGFFSRVYQLKDTPWVIKEGRWDLDLKVTSKLDLPLPARVLQTLIRPFNYHFQPTPKEIIKQYQDYLLFAEYFGFFSQNDYYHPHLAEIRTKQKIIRASLSDALTDLEARYGLTNLPKIKEVLNSEILSTNFLPQE